MKAGPKYQLLLCTSNPPGLVYMGKMLSNEGGDGLQQIHLHKENDMAIIVIIVVFVMLYIVLRKF